MSRRLQAGGAAGPLTGEAVALEFGLSAETLERLAVHLNLLAHWQRRINLVGASTLADPWRRHVLDSLQLIPHVPSAAASLIDLGSGAGFPGLVLAIATGIPARLIDSDARKGVFLREAIRVTAAPATVITARIEALRNLRGEVVTARACAPLNRLLALAAPVLAPDGRCLFLKGREVEAELTGCEKDWIIRADHFPSRADPSGCVLVVKDIRRRDEHRPA